MAKKSITKICRKFKNDMQKTVDGNGGIDKISMSIPGYKPVVIAERKLNPNERNKTMAKKKLTITGKIKKLESVKGTDRLVIENLDLPMDKLYELKKCANLEEAVSLEITPLQEDLPGID